MLKREKILTILNRARLKYEMFGAARHQYHLNPPIRASFVRQIEKRYGFKLPEDYFHFITEIGDGGAGPDYGIEPFVAFLEKKENPRAEEYAVAYQCSLAKEFKLRPMKVNEVEEYAIAMKEVYLENPKQYFVDDAFHEEDLCITNGFFVLGTHGCQWDFGIAVSGEKRGQIFDMDNEGAYGFVAYSFEEFYQNWLDQISNKEQFLKELENWKNIFKKETK
ncbi:MAG: SMI1/KNR4 family protein [Lachnospiraceae bacterium]